MTDFQRNQVADDGTDMKFLKVDSNRYLYVNIAAGGIIPGIERKHGSDCSGSDGDTGRVLTLNNTTTTSLERVYVDGMLLFPTEDYTVNHLSSNSTITFTKKIWDSQSITVVYQQ